MNETIRPIRLEDGRYGEQHVQIYNDGAGIETRIVETHAEQRQLYLHERTTERSKPFVYERRTETIDPATGLVVASQLESTEPRMQAVRAAEYVTRKDLADTLAAIIQEGQGKPVVSMQATVADKVSTIKRIPYVEIVCVVACLGLAGFLAYQFWF